MSLFSRRIIARALRENRRFLTKKQLREHVAHLNGSDQIRRVTTEWEVMILNGLDKLGVVVHEPEVPGLTKIDARLTHETGTSLIEITSVSDRGLDEANPVGQLSEELIRRVIEFGLNPSHFSLDIKGNSHELFLGGPRARLYMPASDQFGALIFAETFYRFLNEARASGISRTFRPDQHEAGQVTISFNPNQTGFSCGHLDYTVPFSLDDNPVYFRLMDEADQLEKSHSPEWKGIVLCDGGSSVLRHQGRQGMSYGVDDIITAFLAKNDSVAFVLTVLVSSNNIATLSPEHLRLVSKPYLSRHHPAAAPFVSFLHANLCANLPSPETTPINAYSLDNEGKSFYGGGSMSALTIRISARTVLGLLSGQIDQQDFIRDNPDFSAHFDRLLREGRVLDSVFVKHCQERDDDWMEFLFSDADPAVGRFSRGRADVKAG
jgi:hypothetical protein